MRLFLGLEISDSVKSEIASHLSPIKKSGKGWENSHDYHLTLLFIGEVPSPAIREITARMIEIKSLPFQLTSTRLQLFSRRILYLGFEHSPEILSLREEVLRIYPEYYRKEEKEFVPHLTVKRCQGHEHAQLVSAIDRLERRPLTIEVPGLALFKSEKDPESNKYHVIQRVSF